jgi:hypothetical protein
MNRNNEIAKQIYKNEGDPRRAGTKRITARKWKDFRRIICCCFMKWDHFNKSKVKPTKTHIQYAVIPKLTG